MSEKMIKRNGTNGKTFVLCIAIILMLLALATPVSAAISLDFSQCANAHKDGQTPFEGCWWIRGIDQTSKSEYYEGDVVNQRVVLEQLPTSPTGEYWFTFSHMATKGGIHGYDFLTSWNDVPMINTDPVNECGDQISATDKATCVALMASGYSMEIPVPGDAFVSNDGGITQEKIDAYVAANGPRTITIYSDQPFSTITPPVLLGPIHSGSKSGGAYFDPAIANGGDTGDTYVHYLLKWKPTSPSAVFMVQFAGHLAVTGDGSGMSWGTKTEKGKLVNLGSSGIQGGSWHFFTYDVYLGSQANVASLGSKDNQIQAPELKCFPGVLTITKSASRTEVTAVNQEITYTYTVCNTGQSTVSGISATDSRGLIINGLATSLLPGACDTGTATYTIDQDDLDACDDICNTATVSGTDACSTTVGDTTDAYTCVTVDGTDDVTIV